MVREALAPIAKIRRSHFLGGGYLENRPGTWRDCRFTKENYAVDALAIRSDPPVVECLHTRTCSKKKSLFYFA